jgi:transcriptional regulator with PAS, ATPase and Fis domain
LAHHFLERVAERMNRPLTGFTNAAMDRLTACRWPGNVRELENEIERVVALAGSERLVGVEMLSEHVRGGAADGDATVVAPEIAGEPNMTRAVEALKRHMIVAALRDTGNKTRAAERLGIPRQSLQKMIKRLEIGDDEIEDAGRDAGG